MLVTNALLHDVTVLAFVLIFLGAWLQLTLSLPLTAAAIKWIFRAR
ncbi:hypothetical protein MHH37_05315 [Solibacillus sp. FSL K6-1781]